ncbi:MAG: phosphoesterase [Candidatus Aenigmarchaeota archaeon ex4484_224]|nr:MAG: phosphoesterase [Candidatus Aenigmarchaeota archaeon ex4484_224]
MKILNEIEIFNGYPAIFIPKISSLVISDLQLGYEQYLASKGIFVPQTQLKEILKDLKELIKITKPKKLIINGDLKHEFGKASEQEWKEVRKLTSFLEKEVKEIILVRGNHDNYLLTIASHLGLKVYDPIYCQKEFCFTHGHKKVDIPKECKFLIIGHEQPAILLRSGLDRIKIPALIYGKWERINLICLPSFSPLASGVAINAIEKEELLSPILKEANLDNFKAIGFDKEVGALKFPEIRKIKVEIE